MIRSTRALLTAAVLLGSLTAGDAAAQTGSLSLQVPLFRTKAKGDIVKFTPFKSAKDPFQVTVALFDGDSGEPLFLEDGVTPWTETFLVTANNAAPSDPANGDLREPARVTGATTVVLGSTVPLPPDLLTRSVEFTSTLTLIKKGQALPPFDESPRRPLGLDGVVTGQALAPAAVTTEALTLVTGAQDGLVLTSDGVGNASWQPLPDLPGVAGTPTRLAVFDSPNSIADSSISDTGSQVLVQSNLEVTGLAKALDVVADDDLVAGDDLVVGDDMIATGDVQAANAFFDGNLSAATMTLVGDANAGNLTSFGFVRTGSPSTQSLTTGDIAATDDLIADDDVFVGDDVIAGGSGLFGSSVSGTTGSFSGSLSASAVNATGSITAATGSLVTGTPAIAFSTGDIASTSDLFADGDVSVLDDVIAGDDLVVGDRATIGQATVSPGAGDLAVADDIIAQGQIDVHGTFVSNLSSTNSELMLRSNGDQVFIRDFNFGDNGLVDETQWFDGPAGLGGDLEMRLDSAGGLSIDGTLSSGGADLAEWFPTVHNGLQPGTLVALDAERPEHVLAAQFGVREVLLGVVPTEPGLIMGNGDVMGPQPDLLRASHVAAEMGDMEKARSLRALWRDSVDNQAGRVAVALQGRVPVKVDVSGGVILPGDRLGMSARAGYATRYTGYGPVVGLAMEGFDGTGDDAIVVFLDLDHSPDASSSGAQGALTLVDGLAELERAATVRGQGFVPRGATRVVVQDVRLGAGSLPVVTFYGNPGGHSWVSERGPGWFVLELSEPAPEGLDFGFSATP